MTTALLLSVLLLMSGIMSANAADRWVVWCRTGLMSEPRIKQGGWMWDCREKDDPTGFQTQAACLTWSHQVLRELSGKKDVIERSEAGWRTRSSFTSRAGSRETLLGEVGCFPAGARPPR